MPYNINYAQPVAYGQRTENFLLRFYVDSQLDAALCPGFILREHTDSMTKEETANDTGCKSAQCL